MGVSGASHGKVPASVPVRRESGSSAHRRYPWRNALGALRRHSPPAVRILAGDLRAVRPTTGDLGPETEPVNLFEACGPSGEQFLRGEAHRADLDHRATIRTSRSGLRLAATAAAGRPPVGGGLALGVRVIVSCAELVDSDLYRPGLRKGWSRSTVTTPSSTLICLGVGLME